MAEDFTEYDEYDEQNRIAVTASLLTLTSVQDNARSYLIKELAEVQSNFVHQFEFKITGYSGEYALEEHHWWAAALDLNDYIGWLGHPLAESWDGKVYLQGETQDSCNIDLNTMYYVTVTRSTTTLQVDLYTDSGRTNLHDTLSVTCVSDDCAYIYLVDTNDTEGATNNPAGTFGNLLLEEEGIESVTATARVGGIRHTYRPGLYKMELTLGGVTLTPEVIKVEMAIPEAPEEEAPAPVQKVTVPEKTEPHIKSVVKRIVSEQEVVKDMPLSIWTHEGKPIEYWPSSDIMTRNDPRMIQMKELMDELNKRGLGQRAWEEATPGVKELGEKLFGEEGLYEPMSKEKPKKGLLERFLDLFR